MDIDAALIEEAKRLREKYYETEDYQGVYAEYLGSRHWKALKSEMGMARVKKCEVCGSKDYIELHHLHYREWHDVGLEDLAWLCDRHHELLHKVIGVPKGENSHFLIRSTMRKLFEHDKLSIVQELDTVKSANISLKSALQRQKAAEPQIVYVPAPEPAKKASRSISLWMTILAVAVSFGAGWLLRPSTVQTEKSKPSRIERVK